MEQHNIPWYQGPARPEKRGNCYQKEDDGSCEHAFRCNRAVQREIKFLGQIQQQGYPKNPDIDQQKEPQGQVPLSVLLNCDPKLSYPQVSRKPAYMAEPQIIIFRFFTSIFTPSSRGSSPQRGYFQPCSLLGPFR